MSKHKPGDHRHEFSDEDQADVREGTRQAAEEKARLPQIADEAEQATAAEDTAPAAKRTFWDRVHSYLGRPR